MEDKEYIDNQIRWLKGHIDTEISSVRQAVQESKETNVQKFEAQNEWRQQFKDQTSTFVTRRELWAAVLAIVTLIVGIYLKK